MLTRLNFEELFKNPFRNINAMVFIVEYFSIKLVKNGHKTGKNKLQASTMFYQTCRGNDLKKN